MAEQNDVEPGAYNVLVNQIADALPRTQASSPDSRRADARRIIAEVPNIRRIAEKPTAAADPKGLTPHHFGVETATVHIADIDPQLWANLNGSFPGVELSYMQQAEQEMRSRSLKWRTTEGWSTDTYRLEVLARNAEVAHLISQRDQEREAVSRLTVQNESLKQRNAELGRGRGTWPEEEGKKSAPVDEAVDKPLVASGGWSSPVGQDIFALLTDDGPAEVGVGDSVFYYSRGSADGKFPPTARAAIVTEVPELLPEEPNSGPEGYVPAVHLCVLNPTGIFFDQNVPYAAEVTGGHWGWTA